MTILNKFNHYLIHPKHYYISNIYGRAKSRAQSWRYVSFTAGIVASRINNDSPLENILSSISRKDSRKCEPYSHIKSSGEMVQYLLRNKV